MTKRPGTIWQEHREAAAAFRAVQNETTWLAYVAAKAASDAAVEAAWDAYQQALAVGGPSTARALATWREVLTGDPEGSACDTCGQSREGCQECAECGTIGCECLVTTDWHSCRQENDGQAYCRKHEPWCGFGCPVCDPDYGR